MPVYNGGNYFALALRSALAQDYPALEIVIVNDGSTDDGETERIALSYGDRVRYVRQGNGGVASALNHALRIAKGDYFAWLSHDDIHLPHKTSAQIAFLSKLGRPEACLFSDYDLIGPEGATIRTVRLPTQRIRHAPRWPLVQGMINGCSLLVPMHLMRRYGPFDESLRYVQDYDLWSRILADHEFFHQPEVLVQYRIHPGQDTHKPQVVDELNPAWIRIMDSLSPVARAHVHGSSARYFEQMAEFIGHSRADLATVHATSRAHRSLAPPVSVVVLDRGSDADVETSIRSVLAQDYSDLEIVIAVSRPSLECPWVRLDDRVRLVRSTDGCALQEALLGIRGEYAVVLDEGDALSEARLHRQVERMSTNGILVSVAGHDDMSARHPHTSSIMMHRLVVDAGFGPEASGDSITLPWAELTSRYQVLAMDEHLMVSNAGHSLEASHHDPRISQEWAGRRFEYTEDS